MTHNNPGKSKDALFMRILSAVVMIPAGLVVVSAGGIVLVLACVACGIGMWLEYQNVSSRTSGRELQFVGGVLITLNCLASLLGISVGFMVTGLSSVLLGFYLCLHRTPKCGWLVAGFVVINAALLSLLLLRNGVSGGLQLTLAIMVCVWSTDIFAYFAGRGFGGPKLAPQGSPNKTWSGAAGAVICTVLIGALLAGLFGASLLLWAPYAALISMVAQLGDLIQSYWKRRFDVKDSSSLIPGHGGLLDRLDSFSAVLITTSATSWLVVDFPQALLG